jgi:hypothetical protein
LPLTDQKATITQYFLKYPDWGSAGHAHAEHGKDKPYGSVFGGVGRADRQSVQ